MNLRKLLIRMWFGATAIILIAYMTDTFSVYESLSMWSFFIVATGLGYIIFRKVDKRMSAKEVFLRRTLAISLIIFLAFIMIGIIWASKLGDIKHLFPHIKLGLAAFAGVWIVFYGVYFIGNYIKQRFRASNNEQKAKNTNEDEDK